MVVIDEKCQIEKENHDHYQKNFICPVIVDSVIR